MTLGVFSFVIGGMLVFCVGGGPNAVFLKVWCWASQDVKCANAMSMSNWKVF